MRPNVSDAAANRLADESPGQAGSGTLATSIPPHSALNLADEISADVKSSTGEQSIASANDGSSNSTTPEKSRSHWFLLDPALRRLCYWAIAVLVLGVLLRVGNAVQPRHVSPKEQFQAFADMLSERLPVILYGEDPFGQSTLPVEVKWEMLSSPKEGGPTKAVLSFEDATFTGSGQMLFTRFSIDYDWKGDHWECHNLKCDVVRPELSKLDQMDFKAVLAHESAVKMQELIKLKRTRAESLLKPNMPLGGVLRSANAF